MRIRLTEYAVSDPERFKNHLNIVLRELGSKLRVTDAIISDENLLVAQMNQATTGTGVTFSKEIVANKKKFVEQVNTALTKKGV